MPTGHGDKERLWEDGIAALLTEKTIDLAARKIGVAPSTLKRWRKDPDFERQYRRARRLIVDDAVTRLQKTTGMAVKTLRRNMRCGNPGAEVRAAQIVMEFSLKAVEVGDLAQRVEELERLLLEQGFGNGGDGNTGPPGGEDDGGSPPTPGPDLPSDDPEDSPGPRTGNGTGGNPPRPLATPRITESTEEETSPLFPPVG